MINNSTCHLIPYQGFLYFHSAQSKLTYYNTKWIPSKPTQSNSRTAYKLRVKVRGSSDSEK